MGKVLIKCIQTPKKLNKNMKKNRNTIESFGCGCGCGCPCSYCAATWLSQHNADASRVVISNDNSVMY